MLFPYKHGNFRVVGNTGCLLPCWKKVLNNSLEQILLKLLEIIYKNCDKMSFVFKDKIKSLFYVCLSATGTYSSLCIYKGDDKFYKDIIMPFVRLFDPEQAHKLAIFMSQHRLIPKSDFKDSKLLNIKLFGKEFSNPIGIAAGFDKNGTAILGLKDIGFGFIEIGSVTPLPQPGNDKPRVFRLSEDKAVINRYGFNNEGHNCVLKRLQELVNHPEKPIIGVNLGKNKNAKDAVKDYVEGVKTFGPISDYLVINVSSPNTPNLRNLQNKENLRDLLKAVVAARNNLNINQKPPILLKLAPDLNEQEKIDISDIIKEKDCKIDGLIICNTTIERPALLKSKYREEVGGLSGKPLKDKSTQMIKEMSKLTNGTVVIIGVGGISSAEDIYEKLKAGASLVQIYSALIYDGPPLVSKMKRELEEVVKNDG